MKSVLFVLLITLTVTLVAQDEPENMEKMRISLFGGASLPQSDFGSTSSQKSGFAKTGFCAMLEGSKRMDQSLNWTSSVSLSINGTDEAVLQSQAQQVFGSGTTVTAGSYVTTWVMTGLKFESPTSSTGGIYAMGQIGILFSSFPDMTFSNSGSSITQTASLATAFAYGFGGGFQTEKVNIGLRYYTGEPEYEQSVSGSGISGSAKVKLPATVLQLMLGVNL